MFQPPRKFLPSYRSRRCDIIASRTRLLHSKLNAGLFKIGLHVSGECDLCGVAEDIPHFLLECIRTVQLRQEIKNVVPACKEKWQFQALTTCTTVMDIIVKFIVRNNISY